MVVILSLESELGEDVPVAFYENDADYDWKNPFYIYSEPGWELHAFSCISLIDEVIPSPSDSMGAEYDEEKRSQRHYRAGYQKVLEIQHRSPRTQRLEG